MVAADLNLTVPRRLGEPSQSSQGHGGRHGIGRAKTKRGLALSRDLALHSSILTTKVLHFIAEMRTFVVNLQNSLYFEPSCYPL